MLYHYSLEYWTSKGHVKHDPEEDIEEDHKKYEPKEWKEND